MSEGSPELVCAHCGKPREKEFGTSGWCNECHYEFIIKPLEEAKKTWEEKQNKK